MVVVSILSLLLILLLILYTKLIGTYTLGWQLLQEPKTDGQKLNVRLSVIIAARNEEINLNGLLKALELQSYPKGLYDVIIVNDHSDDNTVAVFENTSKSSNICLIQLPEDLSGKKAAINYGIQQSKGELIITTDADCDFNKDWLASIVSFYQHSQSKMIIGPVAFTKQDTFFSKLQSLEFISLIASTAGAAATRRPIMCNGANLAFQRKAFDSVNGYEGVEKNASGDDVFLMHKIKSIYGSNHINFLKAKEAIVYTDAKNSLKEFITQRKRWASKATNYTDKHTQYVSWLVFLLNFMLILSFGFIVLDSKLVFIPLASLALKAIIDYKILSLSTAFFNRKHLMSLLLVEELLYSFYVCYIAFTAPFGKYKWKGRRVS